MATLVFTALGSALGGPLFAAAGAIAGGALDSALIGSPTREGARLNQLAVTTSSYGDALPRHFGHMRAAGTVIWAADLVEHSQTTGGGKGKPKLKSYSYACSFAVALASRPISRIGRIWADGNLLRGADGMLKVGGTLRIHDGHGDQGPDSLIAAAEGVDHCPAWRGTAYVVFEDLQLAEFGNRIPSLTFEILADDAPLLLQKVLGDDVAGLDAPIELEGVRGLTLGSSPADLLATLIPVFPVTCDASGAQLLIARESEQTTPRVLGEAASSDGRGDFGAHAGYVRQRAASTENPPRILRYYDIDRDFQPGAQRAGGKPLPGQPQSVDLPAAMEAADARRLIARAAHASGWARDTLQWRMTELDPAIGPGSLVNAPGHPGLWRVLAWEWRECGIELALERVSPLAMPLAAASAGRAANAADRAAGATALVVFELPWDGQGSGDVPLMFAAVSSAGAGWSGAELSVATGDGSIIPIGQSGRARSVIGTAIDALGNASPHLLDRANTITVDLLGNDMALASATPRQLADGANRAFLGDELLQFGTATALGGGRWQLGLLLRGRGGTEHRIAGHLAGEPFVLLDETPVALESALVGNAPDARIAAVGLMDAEPVLAPIRNRGLTLQPLAPVHTRTETLADGSLVLSWTRRSRGAWRWLDGVDVPLHEQAEAYEVSLMQGEVVAARWAAPSPSLTIDAAQVSNLRTNFPGGELRVRQRGTYALSPPVKLASFS